MEQTKKIICMKSDVRDMSGRHDGKREIEVNWST